MNPAELPEEIPRTLPRPPRCPEPPIPAAARRRHLRRARRTVAGLPLANRFQAELQGVTLAMIRYMRDHWCGPGHAYDFERWWCIVGYYARVLDSPELAGARNRELLDEILDQIQVQPKDV